MIRKIIGSLLIVLKFFGAFDLLPYETRITFLRYEDDLGFCFYRFVGVFRLDKEKSKQENKCVWERISDTYQLNV